MIHIAYLNAKKPGDFDIDKMSSELSLEFQFPDDVKQETIFNNLQNQYIILSKIDKKLADKVLFKMIRGLNTLRVLVRPGPLFKLTCAHQEFQDIVILALTNKSDISILEAEALSIEDEQEFSQIEVFAKISDKDKLFIISSDDIYNIVHTCSYIIQRTNQSHYSRIREMLIKFIKSKLTTDNQEAILNYMANFQELAEFSLSIESSEWE